jgi:hexosaminidase
MVRSNFSAAKLAYLCKVCLPNPVLIDKNFFKRRVSEPFLPLPHYQRQTNMYIRSSLMIFVILLGALAPVACQHRNKPPVLQIIPAPVSYSIQSGVFLLKPVTRLLIPAGKPDWETAAQYFALLSKGSTGFDFKIENYNQEPAALDSNAVYFIPDQTVQNLEGYHLDIKPGTVVIRARTGAGAFYAVQTMRQLLPAQFNRDGAVKNVEWSIPACTLDDAPRFSYRGMHLDAGRHFFPVSFVKRYIDLLAMHKFNTFHWHLTEDQGWRIEIKKFPQLQKLGACRKETVVGHAGEQPAKYDGESYCGFYTQEEVKEVVEYARRRFVTIIPEIEMPGHALGALAAFPELGCTGGPYETATTWGVFKDVFCAGNEKTFEFLDQVIAEVAALFPGQYIHVGGDECPKDRWKTCPKCQKRMHDENLKDEHELQSYFIHRAEKMLAKHGKKLIGWDEILEGGLSPTATVMSWRGIEGGIAAARQHHDVIMTPTDNCYFDYYQGDPASEPLAIGGNLTIEKVYAYEPVPAELTGEESKYILGTQGNLWTEYVPGASSAEYMAFPRACALAEVAWSAKEKKDWKGFAGRLVNHLGRLDIMRVNYSKAYFAVSASYKDGSIALQAADPVFQIHYTTDDSEPSVSTALYTKPFGITQSTIVKAATFQGSKKWSNTYSVFYQVHKASGKPYTLSKQPEKYTGGASNALTNGVTGNYDFRTNWVGLVNHDLDPTIDFGAITTFDKVSTHYYSSRENWIYPPVQAEVLVSDDGITFRSVVKKDIDAGKSGETSVEKIELNVPGTKARYLKVVLKSYGLIPAGATGAGNGAWLFADEIIVE